MSRLGQHDVGHEGVITGCDALSLRSPTCSLQGLICDADPQGVAQSPLQSTNAQRCIFWHGLIYSYKTKLQQYCLSVCESEALAITVVQLLPCYKSQYYSLLK